MPLTKIAAVILAAGQGTRMQATTTNKVAMPLGQKPLIAHTVSHLKKAHLGQIVVVVGFASGSVKKALPGESVTYASQRERLGTGHALLIGLQSVAPKYRTVISLYGDDSAFYPENLYRKLVETHLGSKAAITLMTISVPNPTGLGRILRGSQGEIMAIVEEKNTMPAQKTIREINSGLFCFDRLALTTLLPQIPKNPVSGEYYLTDIIALARNRSLPVVTLTWPDHEVWQGVNTPEELKGAQQKILSLTQAVKT